MLINNLYHTWFVEIRQLRPLEKNNTCSEFCLAFSCFFETIQK